MLEDGLAILSLLAVVGLISSTKGVAVGEQSSYTIDPRRHRHDGTQPLAQWTKGNMGPIPVEPFL